MNPELKRKTPEPSDLYIENFIKEVFLDSETDVIALSALPSQTEEGNVLPPELLVKTRDWVNELTRSPRVISHGVFTPELGTRNLEAMQVQSEKLRIEAWKGYSGVSRDSKRTGWTIDDEKIAYPALEYARKLKVKNICLHKGLPFPGEQLWWQPMDVIKAARDFPDLNFLVYHAGFKGVGEVLPAARNQFKTTSYVPWVSDICTLKQKNPKITNVYMELGSTFALMVSSSPLLCAHVLGMIIKAFGDDHVLWGTDSIWWGSPQWQIEAFRRLEMPATLARRFGYTPLTTEVKRKILGLNAARVYGVDPQAKRQPVPSDYVEKLRQSYRRAGPTPSNTQYGWVSAR
jgi:predicted TIM-barrel fold metal-dependent hydrolase